MLLETLQQPQRLTPLVKSRRQECAIASVVSPTTLECGQVLPSGEVMGVATADWLIGKEHSLGVQAIWSQLILCGVRLMLMVASTDPLLSSMVLSGGVVLTVVLTLMTLCLPGEELT
jgi:hypothetical protein